MAWAYDWQIAVQQDSGIAQGSPYGSLAVELSTQDEAIRQKVLDIFNGIQEKLQTDVASGNRGRNTFECLVVSA